MTNTLLAVNAGSSSVKVSLFARGGGLSLLAECQVKNIGEAPVFTVASDNAEHEQALPPASTHEDAFAYILRWIETSGKNWSLAAAAHRVVHGGQDFTEPVLVTPEVLHRLQAFIPLAPLHQPHNLAAIDIVGRLKPGLPQIAVFDTAFHAHQDSLHKCFALPEHLRRQGIRRYGFHGLSYEWIARVLKKDHPALARGKVVAAHLGNGASLCAMHNGQSVDTTMGMTALDGLPMGTRCGALDPGAVLYMIRTLGMAPEDVEDALYNDSGLKGLSGATNDVKKLLASPDPHAAFALDFLALKTAQFAATMAVSLGGIDALIFTGGIGENAAPVRKAVLDRLRFLDSFQTLVIPADEDRMMALHMEDMI